LITFLYVNKHSCVIKQSCQSRWGKWVLRSKFCKLLIIWGNCIGIYCRSLITHGINRRVAGFEEYNQCKTCLQFNRERRYTTSKNTNQIESKVQVRESEQMQNKIIQFSLSYMYMCCIFICRHLTINDIKSGNHQSCLHLSSNYYD